MKMRPHDGIIYEKVEAGLCLQQRGKAMYVSVQPDGSRLHSRKQAFASIVIRDFQPPELRERNVCCLSPSACGILTKAPAYVCGLAGQKGTPDKDPQPRSCGSGPELCLIRDIRDRGRVDRLCWE